MKTNSRKTAISLICTFLAGLALLSSCTDKTPPKKTTQTDENSVTTTTSEKVTNPPITEKVEYMAEKYTEKYRPQYHITPEKNWLNDPNGLVYYNGRWHIFYQYNPNTKFPGDDKWWAHVSSDDLVNWQEEPIALSPDKNGSMWSGSAVVDANNTSGLFDKEGSGLVAFYTVRTSANQQQAMAYSKDGGKTWIKYNDGKAIITTKDDPAHDGAFRDPKVFWHEESGKWMMIVAGGPLRFYSSSNLIDWEQEGYSNSIHAECPDLFKMKVKGSDSYKWVLSGAGVWYMVGDFKKVGGKWNFVPETDSKRFNFAPDVYAGQTFSNTGDRVIMLYWMTDVGYAFDNGKITDPWNGALTLPYELTLVKEGRKYTVCSEAVSELSALRRESFKLENFKLSEGMSNPLADLQYRKCEMIATLDVGESAGFDLRLRVGNGEYTSFSYQSQNGILCLDRSQSGQSPTGRFLSNYTVAAQPENGKIKLHIFVDHSSVEIFAQDGKYPFTALVYPDESSVGISLSAIGGDVNIDSLEIYNLQSIYDKESYQKIPLDVFAVSEKKEAFVGDVFSVFAVTEPLDTNGANVTWTVDEGLEIIETTKRSVKIKVIATGEHKISMTALAADKQFGSELTVTAVENGFKTNLENLTVYGGTWKETPDGLYASGRGNSPILSSSKAGDFTYEATFKYTGSNVGIALIFRAKDDFSRYYTADINLSARSARILRFNRDPSSGASSDITLGAPFTFKATSDNVYTLRVEAKGNKLMFYVNDVLAVSVTDNLLLEGRFGLNVCDADGYFTDVYYTVNDGEK